MERFVIIVNEIMEINKILQFNLYFRIYVKNELYYILA
jgi:hypothetical protein